MPVLLNARGVVMYDRFNSGKPLRIID